MDFYIKRITAHAYQPEREDSTVEFTRDVNLIVGASDTGKSAVLRCIKFMFGGEKPFDAKAKGFNKVTMVLETMRGEITLTRFIGQNRIKVESDVPGVPVGEYGLIIRRMKTKKKSRLPSVGSGSTCTASPEIP